MAVNRLPLIPSPVHINSIDLIRSGKILGLRDRLFCLFLYSLSISLIPQCRPINVQQLWADVQIWLPAELELASCSQSKDLVLPLMISEKDLTRTLKNFLVSRYSCEVGIVGEDLYLNSELTVEPCAYERAEQLLAGCNTLDSLRSALPSAISHFQSHRGKIQKFLQSINATLILHVRCSKLNCWDLDAGFEL